MSRLTPKVRETVSERDQWRCTRCGEHVQFRTVSIHHRRPAGSGGSRRPETHLPANLILLCGSGVTGCHGWVESHRTESYELGLLVHQGIDPAGVSVQTYRGRLLLDNEGFFTEVAA